jgi:excisionase family DNA binding protein
MPAVYLTAAEAATYLNVPERTFRDRWRRWGIKGHHFGRHLRFRPAELDRWADRNAEVHKVAA